MHLTFLFREPLQTFREPLPDNLPTVCLDFKYCRFELMKLVIFKLKIVPAVHSILLGRCWPSSAEDMVVRKDYRLLTADQDSAPPFFLCCPTTTRMGCMALNYCKEGILPCFFPSLGQEGEHEFFLPNPKLGLLLCLHLTLAKSSYAAC